MLIKLQKMSSTIEDGKLSYWLNADEKISINAYLGKKMQIRFTGNIFCVNCDAQIKKSYNNGYCYKCFLKLAVCDMCIMKPEICHYDKGTCRDNEFALKYCMIPHVVYISDTSELKVGITRAHQKLTRWIDQGASKAVAFWQVNTRKESGLVEVFLKEYIKDKTNWRNMLKGLESEEDIEFKRDELIEICESADLPGEAIYDDVPEYIQYPVESYPEKVSSINLDKQAKIEAVLTGIRGQYLLFSDKVINIRSHAGYEVEILSN